MTAYPLGLCVSTGRTPAYLFQSQLQFHLVYYRVVVYDGNTEWVITAIQQPARQLSSRGHGQAMQSPPRQTKNIASNLARSLGASAAAHYAFHGKLHWGNQAFCVRTSNVHRCMPNQITWIRYLNKIFFFDILHLKFSQSNWLHHLMAAVLFQHKWKTRLLAPEVDILATVLKMQTIFLL